MGTRFKTVEDDYDEGSDLTDDGNEVNVDPLVFCKPEMNSSQDDESLETQNSQTEPRSFKAHKIKEEPRAVITITPITKSIPTTNGTSNLIYENGSNNHRKRKADPREGYIWEHPAELKKLLVGDLSKEMTVRVRRSREAPFKTLSHHDCDPNYEQLEVHKFYPLNGSHFKVQTKPQSFVSDSISGGYPPSESPPTIETSNSAFMTDQMDPGNNMFAEHSAFVFGDSNPSPGSSSKQVPPVTDLSGKIEDPETGAVRYICRNNCGTSLASAKGRRKHEKRHCPLIQGGNQTSSGASSATNSQVMSATNRPLAAKPVGFKCRFCGAILSTNEGCKMHEKLLHGSENS